LIADINTQHCGRVIRHGRLPEKTGCLQRLEINHLQMTSPPHPQNSPLPANGIFCQAASGNSYITDTSIDADVLKAYSPSCSGDRGSPALTPAGRPTIGFHACCVCLETQTPYTACEQSQQDCQVKWSNSDSRYEDQEMIKEPPYAGQVGLGNYEIRNMRGECRISENFCASVWVCSVDHREGKVSRRRSSSNNITKAASPSKLQKRKSFELSEK
jgi:hypothetical protein